MKIDPDTAAKLGWPKLKYAWVELERRWLCREVPWTSVVETERISDLYLSGTQLRLREVVPLDGREPMRRLTRKADVSAAIRLHSTIHLSPGEFALLSSLAGKILCKTRYRLAKVDGVTAMAVDVFDGPLAGLTLLEAEFDDHDAMIAFPKPDFAVREVTEDQRYSGGTLVEHGLPTLD